MLDQERGHTKKVLANVGEQFPHIAVEKALDVLQNEEVP